jgi:hypothetical protein
MDTTVRAGTSHEWQRFRHQRSAARGRSAPNGPTKLLVQLVSRRLPSWRPGREHPMSGGLAKGARSARTEKAGVDDGAAEGAGEFGETLTAGVPQGGIGGEGPTGRCGPRVQAQAYAFRLRESTSRRPRSRRRSWAPPTPGRTQGQASNPARPTPLCRPRARSTPGVPERDQRRHSSRTRVPSSPREYLTALQPAWMTPHP